MNMMDILNQAGGIGAIARELGVDEGTAATGAAALLPAILGGFKGQAQAQPEGLGGLIGMLGGMGGGGLLASVLGAGPSNVHLGAGTLTPAELMADIADGVYINELIGQGVNGVTGDYSRGASGFRIVNGELAGPVAEFTIAGNLIEMFAALVPANDLEWYRAINVPTLRIDGMMIAGG